MRARAQPCTHTSTLTRRAAIAISSVKRLGQLGLGSCTAAEASVSPYYSDPGRDWLQGQPVIMPEGQAILTKLRMADKGPGAGLGGCGGFGGRGGRGGPDFLGRTTASALATARAPKGPAMDRVRAFELRELGDDCRKHCAGLHGGGLRANRSITSERLLQGSPQAASLFTECCTSISALTVQACKGCRALKAMHVGHRSPASGSTAEVLSARLLSVAASDVLLTTSTGSLSRGGTTGNGLGRHFGEGS